MSPVWAIWTLRGSTSSCSKTSMISSPRRVAGCEWAMIGTPVAWLVWATARRTFSTSSVIPGSSTAHLRNAALTSVPWMPSSTSWRSAAIR